MDLEHIQKVEAKNNKLYFPEQEQTPTYLGICLAGEVGEVCNEIKKWVRGTQDWEALRSKLVGELPDILIYLVMIAEEFAIDLDGAWEEKRIVNDRRYGVSTTPE